MTGKGEEGDLISGSEIGSSGGVTAEWLLSSYAKIPFVKNEVLKEDQVVQGVRPTFGADM